MPRIASSPARIKSAASMHTRTTGGRKDASRMPRPIHKTPAPTIADSFFTARRLLFVMSVQYMRVRRKMIRRRVKK